MSVFPLQKYQKRQNHRKGRRPTDCCLLVLASFYEYKASSFLSCLSTSSESQLSSLDHYHGTYSSNANPLPSQQNFSIIFPSTITICYSCIDGVCSEEDGYAEQRADRGCGTFIFSRFCSGKEVQGSS